MTKIAYVVSGKVGIHSFTFTELELLERNNIDFILCLTQLKKGPFMPKPHWKKIIASHWSILNGIIKTIFTSPMSFYHLVGESLNDKTLKYLFVAFDFFEKTKKREISAIHCQMADHKLYIGYFLSKLLNKPLTTTLHAHELYQRDVYEFPDLVKKTLNHCTKVITISEFNKRELIESLGIDSKKIEIMRLYPSNVKDDQQKKRKKILIVANWVKKKGYEILFEALSRLNRNDYVLWTVGGPVHAGYSLNLKELEKKYHLEENVVNFGFQSHEIVTILFEACDIFCLPSITEYDSLGRVKEREGIPVAIMEAMSWGKPVISTVHAGIPELVDQILVREGDVDELSEKLMFLLDTPQMWREMGQRNQGIISEKYTQKNALKLVDIFKNI